MDKGDGVLPLSAMTNSTLTRSTQPKRAAFIESRAVCSAAVNQILPLSPAPRSLSKTLFRVCSKLSNKNTLDKEGKRANSIGIQKTSTDHMDTMPSLQTSMQGSSTLVKSVLGQPEHLPPVYGDLAPRYVARESSAAACIDGAKGNVFDDKLPPYTPTLQLLTICRRKHVMESKDRKAKRRTWEIVWLLLDGTALRIYIPTSDEKKKYQKEWNLKYCKRPKQDPKDAIRSVATEDCDETDDEMEDEVPENTPYIGSSTSRGPASNSLQNRGRSSSMQKTPLPLSQPIVRRSTLPPIDTRIANLNIRPTTVLNIPSHPSLPSILSRKAHKSYPVRNATCARPSSYFKRNFVIQFTLEGGKQFLAQLNNYEELLTWVQVMTIATPLALDLDERQMPEPAAYPRPRRTRPQTALANIDTTRIPNLPPSYDNDTGDTSNPVPPARRSLEAVL